MRKIILNGAPETKILVNEYRHVVADVVNQPNGDEPHDAINVGLNEIPENVAIEKFHGGGAKRNLTLIHRYEFCTQCVK